MAQVGTKYGICSSLKRYLPERIIDDWRTPNSSKDDYNSWIERKPRSQNSDSGMNYFIGNQNHNFKMSKLKTGAMDS